MSRKFQNKTLFFILISLSLMIVGIRTKAAEVEEPPYLFPTLFKLKNYALHLVGDISGEHQGRKVNFRLIEDIRYHSNSNYSVTQKNLMEGSDEQSSGRQLPAITLEYLHANGHYYQKADMGMTMPPQFQKMMPGFGSWVDLGTSLHPEGSRKTAFSNKEKEQIKELFRMATNNTKTFIGNCTQAGRLGKLYKVTSRTKPKSELSNSAAVMLVQGTVCIDNATGAELSGKMDAHFANQKKAGIETAHEHIDFEVTQVGNVPEIQPPADASPEPK